MWHSVYVYWADYNYVLHNMYSEPHNSAYCGITLTVPAATELIIFMTSIK